MKYGYEMQRLQALCAEKGFLCVGLDTDPAYIPAEILRLYDSPAAAVHAFNRAVIESTAPYAVCYKVQVAYYEAMGCAGMECYANTLRAVRAAGIPVIADIKRGDIADTASAYARAHFSGDFEADIVTLNPYMGFDTLAPFIEWVDKKGKGAFVLLRTSNPGANDIERLPLDRGFVPESLAKAFPAPDADGGLRRRIHVLDAVGQGLSALMRPYTEKAAADRAGESVPGSGGGPMCGRRLCAPFGAVVGCTDAADARLLRSVYADLFFLIPGYGAQGGAADVAATLLSEAGGVVNSSRGILCAWKKDSSLTIKARSGTLTLTEIAESAGRAAFRAKAELAAAVRNCSFPSGASE